MKLVSTGSAGLQVQQTAARLQCKITCAKLESAYKMNFPTGGSIKPAFSISGVSAGESSVSERELAEQALRLVIESITRGLHNAAWNRKEPIRQVCYNHRKSTLIPKEAITVCYTEAALESFLKKAFHVQADKSVKLTFKTTGEQQKQFFFKTHVAEQLSIAVAVYIDDA